MQKSSAKVIKIISYSTPYHKLQYVKSISYTVVLFTKIFRHSTQRSSAIVHKDLKLQYTSDIDIVCKDHQQKSQRSSDHQLQYTKIFSYSTQISSSIVHKDLKLQYTKIIRCSMLRSSAKVINIISYSTQRSSAIVNKDHHPQFTKIISHGSQDNHLQNTKIISHIHKDHQEQYMCCALINNKDYLQLVKVASAI